MERKQLTDTESGSGWVQVPQDAGCRGVLNRERDARFGDPLRARRRSGRVDARLTAESEEEVNLVVLDGVGEPVATA